MNWVGAPAAALAFIGRRGTLIMAASLVVGLGVPGLAALCKPLLGEVVVLLLTLSFLRVDPSDLRHRFKQPRLIAASAVWVMLVTPALLGTLFVLFGLNRQTPGLFFMLVLQISAPGLMSSPALAALLGLDVALTLASLVVCTALTPLTASLFSHIFLGSALASPYAFGLKLLAIIAGSAAAAAVIRRIAGCDWIAAQRERIDGLSVFAMCLFAVAAMDGVTGHFRADPFLVSKLTALAFALALGQIALTTLIFLPAGRARALAIGILSSNRNMGVMLAATGFLMPDLAWLYFGLAQFPIYLLPHVLKPLSMRLRESA
jgi:BASS family bile acid:Na+ symporter